MYLFQNAGTGCKSVKNEFRSETLDLAWLSRVQIGTSRAKIFDLVS